MVVQIRFGSFIPLISTYPPLCQAYGEREKCLKRLCGCMVGGGRRCGNLSFGNSMEVLGDCSVQLSLTHPLTHSNYKGFHSEELDALNLTF